MADKIVQLKDKDNNNLYPVAGALFSDAVDTASIQNGAVTSDKIDWTTTEDTGITYPSNNAEQHASNPLRAIKFGKIVFLVGYIQLKNYSSAAATLSSDLNAAKLSAEFAPVDNMVFYASSQGNVPLRVGLGPSGTINLGRYKTSNDQSGFAQLAQNTEVRLTCMYFTA